MNAISGEYVAGSGLSELLLRVDEEITGALRQQKNAPEFASDDQLDDIDRHICFSLGGRHLAVPLTFVLEVGELEIVQPLPFLPDWVEGVANIRGEIVSVTDLAAFFNIAPAEDHRDSRTFLIIHNGEMKTAIIVDRITGTRLLYRRKGKRSENGSGQSVLSTFLRGPAVYLLNNAEYELELFDAGRLLSSIRI